VPGTGALIAAIATGAEVQPIAIGKPRRRCSSSHGGDGAVPQTTATLGDRIDTDMEGGRRAGLATILVLSGSTTRAEADLYGPDLVFEEIADLMQAWKEASLMS